MNVKKNPIRMNQMSYMKDFACIGGICEDNCCIGWDVDIDQDTFQKYQKVSDPQLKALYKEKIKPYPYYFDPGVDYARVKLKKDKRCPFLTEEGLCITQSKLGESYLSNVCATYPRMTNEVDGILESTLTLSCPVAARLVLLSQEGLHWETNSALPKRKIVNLSFDTTHSQFKHHPVKHFHALRAASLKIMLDPQWPINRRLYGLGLLFEALAEAHSKKQVKQMPELVDQFVHQWLLGKVSVPSSNSEESAISSAAARLYLTDGIIHRLRVFTDIDSQAFIGYTKDYARAFVSNPKTNKADPKHYLALQPAFKTQMAIPHAYILENYIHNFIYKNLFPFTESENLFEAYAMLAIRVILIETYGTALCQKDAKLSPEAFATFIQVFAKAVEHHKNFTEHTLEALRKEDLFNLYFLSQCLELGEGR